MIDLREFIETLVQHLPDPEDIAEAKTEFHWRIGELDADDDIFDEQMAFFVNWYLCIRKAPGLGDIPLVWLRTRQAKGDADLDDAFERLSQAKLSVYRVAKVKRDHMVLQDLFSPKAKLQVRDQNLLPFAKSGQVLVGWVAAQPDGLGLLDGCHLHPKETTSLIEKTVKKVKDPDPIELSLRLCACRVKNRRYPRLDLLGTYTAELGRLALK